MFDDLILDKKEEKAREIREKYKRLVKDKKKENN